MATAAEICTRLVAAERARAGADAAYLWARGEMDTARARLIATQETLDAATRVRDDALGEWFAALHAEGTDVTVGQPEAPAEGGV